MITDFNDCLIDDIEPLTRASYNNLPGEPQPDVNNHENQAENVTSLEGYPSQAGCVRAREVNRKRIALPAASVFLSHYSCEWNPYARFKSAIEWQMVVLTVEQHLQKHEIDRWIKQHLWRVNTFQSADHLWNLMDNINDAL
jgi:transposase